MAVDAVAPYITRSPGTMVLIIRDKGVSSFNEEGFQLLVLAQCWEMIQSESIFLRLLKEIQSNMDYMSGEFLFIGKLL